MQMNVKWRLLATSWFGACRCALFLLGDWCSFSSNIFLGETTPFYLNKAERGGWLGNLIEGILGWWVGGWLGGGEGRQDKISLHPPYWKSWVLGLFLVLYLLRHSFQNFMMLSYLEPLGGVWDLDCMHLPPTTHLPVKIYLVHSSWDSSNLVFWTSLENILCFWITSRKKRLLLPLIWDTEWVSYSRFVLSSFYQPPPGPGMSVLGGFSFIAVGWMILLTLGGRGSLDRPHMISLFAIW